MVANKQKKKILGDYKRVGSKFIPPFIHLLGTLKDASYAKQTLPELVWWDVIGWQVSQQFAIKLAEVLGDFFNGMNVARSWGAFASDYSALTDDEIESLIVHLRAKRVYEPMIEALDDFLACYPQCPLVRLTPGGASLGVDLRFLKSFESRLEGLFDKRSKEAVLMQAQAVYMGFILGRLSVAPGLALADFPMVADYPATERSKEVGASICSTLNMVVGQQLPEFENDPWAIYFWQRGLDLRPLDLSHLEYK